MLREGRRPVMAWTGGRRFRPLNALTLRWALGLANLAMWLTIAVAIYLVGTQ